MKCRLSGVKDSVTRKWKSGNVERWKSEGFTSTFHHSRSGGRSKNLPDAPCAATCLDAQGESGGVHTDSNRFLILRYDSSLSAASASGCEHFTPCVPASCVFRSGGELPVANRRGTVPLLLSEMDCSTSGTRPVLGCQLLTPDVSAHIRSVIVIPRRKRGGNECHPCRGVRK